MRTFKLTVNEDELKALINHNAAMLYSNMNTEISSRIHDLTKRLNKDSANVETTEEAAVKEKPLGNSKPGEVDKTSTW